MNTPIPTALLVVSDRAARGERADATADLLRPVLKEHGFELGLVGIVADERAAIAAWLTAAAPHHGLLLTTGGTGVAARDVTPEATRDVLDLEVPGLGETLRARSLARTPHAVGSRGLGGFVGRALVLNLPGRPSGAVECFLFVAGALGHLIRVRSGPVPDASHGAADRGP
jgi:molybdopterin adenylyltransferase